LEPQVHHLMNKPTTAIVPTAVISQRIYFVRKTRVMLDADLALLYGVTTKNLNKSGEAQCESLSS
jgi:ORF6N domain